MDRNPNTTRQRDQLARWLAEWQIERAMVGADGELHEITAPAGRAIPTFYAGPAPAPGQVRLLPVGAVPASTARPGYVLLLGPGTPGTWLVVPFVRFAEPAVPGELLSGLSAIHARVLAPWNARLAAAGMLAASRVAARLSAARVAHVRACMDKIRERIGRAADGGFHACFSDVGQRDEGPPLRHPADPRWVYLAAETAAWAGLGPGLWNADRTSDSSNLTAYPVPKTRAELLKAAEPPRPYGTVPRKPRRRPPRP